jgi:hypothetical protein
MTMRFSIILSIVLITLIVKSSAITHWKITETGRIESNQDSPFSLLRPYDLAAFMKQSYRLKRLELLKELISSIDVLTKKEPTKSILIYFEIVLFSFKCK